MLPGNFASFRSMMLFVSSASMALSVASPPVWSGLETKLASTAKSYTLRENLVPSSAPQSITDLLRHDEVAAESVVFYRDTNAWCPFCERVYLYLLEVRRALSRSRYRLRPRVPQIS